MWDSTLHDITIDGATITNARYGAMQYEQPGQADHPRQHDLDGFRDVRLLQLAGHHPPGVTFINNSFH